MIDQVNEIYNWIICLIILQFLFFVILFSKVEKLDNRIKTNNSETWELLKFYFENIKNNIYKAFNKYNK